MHFFKSILASTLLAGLLHAAPIPQDEPRVVLFSSGKYIVTLKPGTSLETRNAHLSWASDLHRRGLARRQDTNTTENMKTYHLYNFQGYAGYFDAAAITEISKEENVAAVEPDLPVYMTQIGGGGNSSQPSPPVSTSQVTQTDAPWGLARISSTEPGSETYTYDESAGEGTFAYVIDSGVNAQHEDFEGRVTLGESFVDGSNTDEAGHGTHVAGTIAGATFGVAKRATIVSVKVFGAGESTELSTILSGFEWAVNDITSAGREGVSVINMSLGTEQGVSTALNSMVDQAFENGVLCVVAAGNGVNGRAIDASETSPASAASAFVVGATDINDRRGSFSNFGDVVDVHAPGVDITSAWIGSRSATNTISGTSMASPHVAGLALYLKALESGLETPDAVAARIVDLAQSGVLRSVPRGTTNLLINNGASGTTSGFEK